MKKTGKVLSAILALVMALSVMSVPVFAETYQDWEYSVQDGDTAPTAVITGYTGTAADVEIPGRILGDAGEAYTVSAVADGAFDGCTTVKNVTVPQFVTEIGEDAFDGCTSLESITVEQNNRNYESENGVLFNAGKTELVYYPIAKRGDYTIPDSVERIAAYAFEGNKYLEVLNTSTTSALQEIGNGAFHGCESLEVADLNDALDLYLLGEEAFSGCEALQFAYLPPEITTIPRALFYGCYYLKEFELPESVITIEESAFQFVRRLETLELGQSVSEIAPGAFDDFSVKSFVVSNESTDFATDDNGVLYNASRTTLIRYPIGKPDSAYKVLGSCTEIGEYAFQGAALTGVQIAAGVNALGKGAFEDCDDGLVVTCPCDSAAAKYCAANGVATSLTHNYVAGTCTGCGDWQHTATTLKLVSVTNASTGVLVKWNAVPGSDGYLIYRAKASATSWANSYIATVDSATSFTDNTLYANDYGLNYKYTVKAYRNNPNTGKKEYSKYNSKGLMIKALKMPTAKLENTATGAVKISWGGVLGANSGYWVYRRDAGTTSWTKLKKTTEYSWTDTTATAGKTYEYTVRAFAYDSADKATYSSAYKAVTIVKLASPAVTPSNTPSGVQLKWKKSAGATGYYVYRKTAGGTYSLLGSTKSTAYLDTGAKVGTTYYYAVRAYNGSSRSSFIAKPIMRLKMTGVSAKNVSGGIRISWTKAAYAKGYYVCRKGSDNSYKKIATTTSLSYIDTNVKPGVTYYYCVYAFNGSYKSNSEATAYKRMTQPVVTLSKPAANRVKVTIKKVTGAKGYEIYRKVGTGSYTKIATTTNLTYTDKNVKAGTKYTYSVRAYYNTYYSANTAKSIK